MQFIHIGIIFFIKVVSDDDKIEGEITDEALNAQMANANYRQNR